MIEAFFVIATIVAILDLAISMYLLSQVVANLASIETHVNCFHEITATLMDIAKQLDRANSREVWRHGHGYQHHGNDPDEHG